MGVLLTLHEKPYKPPAQEARVRLPCFGGDTHFHPGWLSGGRALRAPTGLCGGYKCHNAQHDAAAMRLEATTKLNTRKQRSAQQRAVLRFALNTCGAEHCRPANCFRFWLFLSSFWFFAKKSFLANSADFDFQKRTARERDTANGHGATVSGRGRTLRAGRCQRAPAASVVLRVGYEPS